MSNKPATQPRFHSDVVPLCCMMLSMTAKLASLRVSIFRMGATRPLFEVCPPSKGRTSTVTLNCARNNLSRFRQR